MALPENDLSSEPMASPLLAPDNAERLNLLEDFERGGVALNDPSQGRDVRNWRVYSDGEGVWVVPYPSAGTPPALQFTGSGITEVSMAFDGNMQPTIAYVEGGVVKLRWFDTLVNSMTVTTYPGAVGPMVCLDDKRDIASAYNDIIFAYVRDGNAYYRQQRDRYGVEYLLGSAFGAVRILQLGMGTNNRLQFKMESQPRGAFTDLQADSLFVVSGQDLKAVGDGEVQPATWRSKTFLLDDRAAPGWGRIEGDYPATLVVYGDGEPVYTTPPITSPEPFRLPAQRWREWAIEVVSSARVVEVRVASDAASLF